MSVPVRTCLGCGARAPQADLLRVTATDGVLRVDGARRAPGRGGYLHRDPNCWSAFGRRRGSIRSLRVSVAATERARLIAALAITGESVG